MQNKELQVKALFEKMLADTQEYARTYEHYVADMKGYSEKVQWKLGPISGYQVFRGPEYSFEIDAEIEDPDVLIECDDLRDAKQFFRDGFEDMRDLANASYRGVSARKRRRRNATSIATGAGERCSSARPWCSCAFPSADVRQGSSPSGLLPTPGTVRLASG